MKVSIRLFSMFLDHALLSLILIPLILVGQKFFNPDFLVYPCLAIYLNKDFLAGRSMAKRLLGLQVYTGTNQPANELQCFVRNTIILLWPLEVILILWNPTRRLGDYLARTHVRASDSHRSTFLQDLIKLPIR